MDDGVYWPETLTSITLKVNEITSYGIVEKEVIAVLQFLDVCYTTLVSREITVMTRHSTLAWLMQSSRLNEKVGRWTALLSNWTMEIKRCEKGKENILGALAASKTPREDIDIMLSDTSPLRRNVIKMYRYLHQRWNWGNICG